MKELGSAIFPGTTEVQFLGVGGILLAQEVFDDAHPGIIGSGYHNRIFYGITSDQLIERVRTVEPAGDGDGVIYDDVQFKSAQQSAVPEPNSLMSWTLGGLGMSMLSRYRRKRSA